MLKLEFFHNRLYLDVNRKEFIGMTCIFCNHGEVKFALIIVLFFIFNVLVNGRRIFVWTRLK